MIPATDDVPLKRSLLYAIDVSLVGDDEIAVLNRDYRQKDKPTDVLSFSLWEGDEGEVMPPPRDEMPLGDLVISLDTAARQAEELNHSLIHEIEFLTVHGTLHLLGYDHLRNADRRRMWQWQEKIIEGIKDQK